MATLPNVSRRASLPVYNTTSNINASNTGASRVADQSGEMIGNALGYLGKTVDKLSVDYAVYQQKEPRRLVQIWQNIQNAEATLDAKNSLYARLDGIVQDAQKYPYKNEADLKKQLSDFHHQVDTEMQDVVKMFANEQNAVRFQREQQMYLFQTNENINKIFRDKVIAHQKENCAQSEQRNRDIYVQTGSKEALTNYSADLDIAVKGLVLSADEKKDLVEQAEVNWEKDRLLYLATNDPTGTQEQIDRGEITADEETMAMIKSAIEKQQKMDVIKKQENDFAVRKEVESNLPNMNLQDALKTLEIHREAFGEELFEAKKKSLLSSAGITAQTQAEDFSKVLLALDDLSVSDDVASYDDAKSIEVEIDTLFADGKLSEDDRSKLTSKLYTEKQQKSLVLKGDQWVLVGDFSYKDAQDYIDQHYDGTLKDSILLDYFKVTFDTYENLDSAQKTQILSVLIDSYCRDNSKKGEPGA